MEEREALELCRDIAHRIREGIEELSTKDAGTEVYMGADGTPTKRIDDVAERIALDAISEGGHSMRVVSEECGEVSFGGSENTLILDPIDGTTNAIRGLPTYSVSMALAEGDLSKVWFGYVYELPSGKEYHAIAGKGAYLGKKRLHVSHASTLSESVLGLYGFAQSPEAVCTLARVCKGIRVAGCASLELCHVASGAIDGFVDLRGKLRITDVAAGALLVREAGGVITDERARQLAGDVNVSTRLRIVAASAPIHERLMKRIAEVSV